MEFIWIYIYKRRPSIYDNVIFDHLSSDMPDNIPGQSIWNLKSYRVTLLSSDCTLQIRKPRNDPVLPNKAFL